MKTDLAIATICLLIALPAMAQSPAPRAQDFVNKVAVSDMFEIQSSQLALTEKQPDKDTKPFAQRMVKDHQKKTAELTKLVDSGNLQELPTALDSDHQKMLDELKAKTGKEFDQSYDQIQVKAHQDAVALFEAYAKDGDNADLKKWAASTLPHLKQHLAMAQKLK
jgi:putative membrane protein